MRTTLLGTAAIAIVIASNLPATAHHSTTAFYDTTKSITLEEKIVRVEWINPHILLFLESKNEEGELETWILEGSSLNGAMRRPELKNRLQPGIMISARAHPARNALTLNEAQIVRQTQADDVKKSPRIVEAGEVRLPDGEIQSFGPGPKF